MMNFGHYDLILQMLTEENEVAILPEEPAEVPKQSFRVSVDQDVMSRLKTFAKNPGARNKFVEMAITLMLEVYEGKRMMPPEKRTQSEY